MVIEPVVPERLAPWFGVDVVIGDPVVHGRPGPLNTADKGKFSRCAFGVVLVINRVFPFDQDIQIIRLVR